VDEFMSARRHTVRDNRGRPVTRRAGHNPSDFHLSLLVRWDSTERCNYGIYIYGYPELQLLDGREKSEHTATRRETVTDSDPLEYALDWQRRLAEANQSAQGIEDVRAINDRFMVERAGQIPADVRVTQVDAGGVPAEWIGIDGVDDGPVILFLHGGGYMLGSAAENHSWAGRLARTTGGRVFAPNYRLAPENKWPTQVDDAATAYRWLLSHDVAAEDIAVLGESAGGGLVIALLVALRDAGVDLPAAAVVTSPLVDFTLASESLTTRADSDQFVTREVLGMMMDAVLQGQDAHEAAPLFRSLSGLPPLLVQVGTPEAIYDDSRRLVEAARAAGVDATLEPWDGMFHLWHGFPDLPQAAAATDRIGEFVRRRTAQTVGAAGQS
jgi:monoterpene epsilon-lactone hydrolase